MQKIFVLGVVVMIALLTGCKKKSASDAASDLGVFTDSFNRADEDLNSNSDWALVSPASGVLQVVSQKLFLNGTSFTSAYHSQDLSSDTANGFVTTMKLSVSGGNVTSSLAYLLAASSTKTQVSGVPVYFCGLQSNRLTLWTDSSTNVGTGTVNIATTDGKSYTLSLTRVGTAITCAITGDATDSLSYTHATPLTGGYFGFAASNGGSKFLYIDDFTVANFEL